MMATSNNEPPWNALCVNLEHVAFWEATSDGMVVIHMTTGDLLRCPVIHEGVSIADRFNARDDGFMTTPGYKLVTRG